MRQGNDVQEKEEALLNHPRTHSDRHTQVQTHLLVHIYSAKVSNHTAHMGARIQ